MTNATFLHSDAWLLLSVICALEDRPAAALPDIIAAADYTNHAIITRGELETGLNRLIAAGYVTQSGDGFAVTDTVKSFWQRTGSKHRQVSKAWDAVEEFIGAPAWAPGPLPDTSAERYVTSADYAAAVKAYLHRMRQRKRPKTK